MRNPQCRLDVTGHLDGSKSHGKRMWMIYYRCWPQPCVRGVLYRFCQTDREELRDDAVLRNNDHRLKRERQQYRTSR